jgi:hypothetical protein
MRAGVADSLGDGLMIYLPGYRRTAPRLVLVDHAGRASPKGLEAVSTEASAMAAARALAELIRYLHALGQRIANELPDQDADNKPPRG